MNLGKPILAVIMASLIILITMGCERVSESVGQSSSTSEQTTRPAGWTDETHGNDVDPNYEIVFPQYKVNQIKITIEPDDWEAMQANMTELFGAPGMQQQGGQPGVGGVRPDGGRILPGKPVRMAP